MQCPDCGSCRRGDGYHREGWYWLECDRRYNPETDTYSPENNRCRLKQSDDEIETLKETLNKWAIRYRSLAEDLALAADAKREQWREYVPETIADEIDALLKSEESGD